MADDAAEAYYRRFLRDHAKRDHTEREMAKGQGTSSRVKEIEGVDSSKVDNFPYSSLKLLGGLQMGIGVTCIVVGLIDLFLFLYVYRDYNNDTLSAMTMACAPVWCGLWFIVAGTMGTCMSLQQKTTLSYFKLTFMVLSLLCTLVFAPALLGTEIYIVVLRSDDAEKASEWLLPLAIAFFALNELICAIITSSICCCCAALNQAKVRILYANSNEDAARADDKHRLSTPELFLADARNRQHYARAQDTRPARTPRTPRVIIDEDDDLPTFGARGYENSRRHLPVPRPEVKPEARVDKTRYYSRSPTYNPANQYHQFTPPGDPNGYSSDAY